MLTSSDSAARVRPDLFAGLPGVAEVIGPHVRSSDVTYYDTADMRLTHARITLHRAEGGEDEGWHVELPVDGCRRRAVHVPLGRSPGAVPDELATLVRAYTANRPLRRCAHIATERETWRLVDDDGVVLAEVSVDTVRGQKLGDREGPVRTWREVEIEHGESSENLLASIGDRLAATDAEPSTTDHKLDQIMESRTEQSIPRLRRRSPAADVVTAYLRTQHERLRVGDVAVRLAEPEGVHDLRVAVRRIRSVLRVFRPILVTSRLGPLERELKWISDLLGSMRDRQVLGTQIRDAVAAVPTELVLGPVQAHIDRYLARPAAEAADAVHTAMTDQRYWSLLDSLDTLLADPPYRDAAYERARDVLPPLVGKAYRTTRKAAGAARRMKPGPDRDAAWHRARRRVKRLRYAVEAVEPVVGRSARRLRRRAKDVQAVLGDQHDLVVLRPALRELGARAQRERVNGFTYGLVHGRADERARDLMRRLPRRWRRLTKRRHTNWLRG